MSIEKQNKVLHYLSLSGAVGVAFYTAHVILGGFLANGYSHIKQTISELTASGAPNADLLTILTTIYGFLLVVFSICTYIIFKRNKENKATTVGALLLIIMELTSFVGYFLFPIDGAGTIMNFQNIMHIVVTGVVVLCTIASSYSMGIGLMRSEKHKKIGILILTCAIIITVFGISTPAIMANNLGFSGLTERINIFSLQTWLFVLSIYLFIITKKKNQTVDINNG